MNRFPSLSKKYPHLTAQDISHARAWRAAGFKIGAIAREYGLSLKDARWLTRGVKRVHE